MIVTSGLLSLSWRRARACPGQRKTQRSLVFLYCLSSPGFEALDAPSNSLAGMVEPPICGGFVATDQCMESHLEAMMDDFVIL